MNEIDFTDSELVDNNFVRQVPAAKRGRGRPQCVFYGIMTNGMRELVRVPYWVATPTGHKTRAKDANRIVKAVDGIQAFARWTIDA